MQRKNQKGILAVEFAILLPVFVLLIFGVVEFSLALYDKAMLTNASREGARAGIVFREPSCLSYGEIKNVVISYLGTHLITFGNAAEPTVTVEPTTCPDPGGSKKVTVSYNYEFLVLPNFINSLIGGITLTGETIMRME